jgi:hypothetical protein
MRFGRGNLGTRRKPAPVPLCPPQILHDLTRARTRPATVGSQRLTAWAMAQSQVTISWSDSVISVYCIGKDSEGSEYYLICGTNCRYAWNAWGKPWRTGCPGWDSSWSSHNYKPEGCCLGVRARLDTNDLNYMHMAG